MRILHTITSMDPRLGGVCQALRTIAYSLDRLGIVNEVVCLDAPDAEFLSNERVKVHALGPTKGAWRYSNTLFPWLENNIGRFDVVIIHGLWQYQSYATAKAIRRFWKSAGSVNAATPKLFVMPHGMLDPYFQVASGRKIKAIRNYIYWKLIERHVINCADGLLFTCEEERLLAHKPFAPYKPKQELVVGLGVDEPPMFSNIMRNTLPGLNKSGQPFLLFMSRINEKKGVDLLLKGYCALKESERAGLELIVAGPGLDTPYGSQLQNLANKNENIGKLISFPGMLSGDRKWAVLYGCSVFVLPSHQENFGIAIVEALACGRPVIISNKVNIWREIDSAQCGLIGDDTLEGTIGLLNKWTQIPEIEKLAMGKRARELYENNFSVEQAANRLLNALKNNRHQALDHESAR